MLGAYPQPNTRHDHAHTQHTPADEQTSNPLMGTLLRPPLMSTHLRPAHTPILRRWRMPQQTMEIDPQSRSNNATPHRYIESLPMELRPSMRVNSNP